MLYTPEQVAECARLKAYFPYRIVYGVIDKDSGEFHASAQPTMRRANKLAREGHHVFIYEVKHG